MEHWKKRLRWFGNRLKNMYMIDPETQKWLINLWLINVSKNASHIKASLRLGNRTQFTNHLINNTVRNEIYPKKSH